MQKLIILYTVCALLFTGCVFGKSSKESDSQPLKPGIHEKVMLTVQGPSGALELDVLKTKLQALPYVLDASTTHKTGVILVCLVPGLAYDIVEIQAVAKDCGYTILKAGKIVW